MFSKQNEGLSDSSFAAKRILSISYDPMLLRTRGLLLRHLGYEVISAEGFAAAYDLCDSRGPHFDLIVLGHSIPHGDKVEIVKRCTAACVCPVLALLRPGELPVPSATRSIESDDPALFLEAVKGILQK